MAGIVFYTGQWWIQGRAAGLFPLPPPLTQKRNAAHPPPENTISLFCFEYINIIYIVSLVLLFQMVKRLSLVILLAPVAAGQSMTSSIKNMAVYPRYVAIGYGISKKFWPKAIDCVLRTAGSSLIWKFVLVFLNIIKTKI